MGDGLDEADLTLPWVALAAAAIALAGCAAPLDKKPLNDYICCNLRAADGWICSNNVHGGALVPLGEPVTPGSIKRRYYVYGEVGGHEVGFRDGSADRSRSDAPLRLHHGGGWRAAQSLSLTST